MSTDSPTTTALSLDFEEPASSPMPRRQGRPIAIARPPEMILAPATRTRRRLPGLLQPRSAERINAHFVPGVVNLRVLQLVAQFGAINVATAARVLSLVDGAAPSSTYWAAQSLERVGLLRRLWIRQVNLGRATGLGIILVAGPAWPELAGAINLPPEPPFLMKDVAVELDAVARRIREQVVLASEVIRRVSLGWTIAVGDQWLAGLAGLERPERTASEATAINRALRAGVLRFKSGDAPVGLLPPEPTGMGALLLGGTFSHVDALPRYLDASALVGPIEVLAVRHSKKRSEQIEKTVASKRAGTARPTLTLMAICRATTKEGRPTRRRRLEWATHWRRVADAMNLLAPATLKVRLGQLLGPTPDPNALP